MTTKCTTQMPNDPLVPVAIPDQMPVTEGMAEIPGTKLGYWDTQGNGPTIILLHPASGSALIWLYQQPVFTHAGYRVIAYSRRNHYNSDLAPAEDPGTGSGDLQHMADFLGVDKFHIVASAAGGSVAADYVLSHPERVSSVTISSNNLAARNGYIADTAARIRPAILEELPRWLWELGPSYRAANAAGTAKWKELNEISETGKGTKQRFANVVTPDKLESIKTPMLLMAGAADMATPPSIMRMIASHIDNCETAVASESGHSPYWEQPEFFNRTVLDFIGGHARS